MKKMFLLAALVLAAPASAEEKSVDIGDWTLFDMGTRGCALSASYIGGTSLTVFADKTEEVAFWIQNPKWLSVQPKAEYKLDIEFNNWGEWPQTVYGMTPDKDGYGFAFDRMTATNDDGDNFVAEFMAAGVMTITRDKLQIAKLSLTGTRDAMKGLLRCVKRKDGDPFDTITPDKPAPQPDVKPTV